jgi:hypothetical protein
MSSPQMMGDELPFPGNSTFHLILFFSLHLMGGAAFFGAMPFDCGPLQVGQFNASPKENLAIAINTIPVTKNRNILSPFHETKLTKVLHWLLDLNIS